MDPANLDELLLFVADVKRNFPNTGHRVTEETIIIDPVIDTDIRNSAEP